MRRGRSPTVRPSPRPRCCRSPSASAPRRRSSASCTPWSSIPFRIAAPTRSSASRWWGRTGAATGRPTPSTSTSSSRSGRPRSTALIASTISDVSMTDAGAPERLRGNYVSMNTFDVMGVPALLGRTPAAADARAEAPPVAVLGYRFWQRQFGGDPDGGRPDAAPGGRAARGHRRDAAALHVARRRRLPADAVPARPAAPWRSHGPRHGPPRPGRRGRGRGVAAPDRERLRGSRAGPLRGVVPPGVPLVRRDVRQQPGPDAGRAARRGRPAAPHRLRQRLEPAARPRDRARPGDGAPRVARREPLAAGASTADRKRAAGGRGRRAGPRADAGQLLGGHDGDPAGDDPGRGARPPERAGAAVLDRAGERQHADRRPGAGLAGVAHRRRTDAARWRPLRDGRRRAGPSARRARHRRDRALDGPARRRRA